MKCVIIIGPQAVGKMTVGRAIAEKTGYKLLHNHMSIDFILPFFEWGTDSFKKLDTLFRFSVMEEMAASNLPGFIFTFMFCLNLKDDWDYAEKIENMFQSKGHEVVYLELEADLETRKSRNTTPLRLEHKPSKRNIEESQKRLLEFRKEYRVNSVAGEFEGRKHLKVNNEKLTPEQVADKAIEEFNL